MAPITYKDAGVNIDEGNRAVQLIKAVLAENNQGGGEIGRFGGMLPFPQGMKDPYLISSTDGVGTKLRIALMAGIYDTVGQDLVNHCVNDILVQGARPLYFMDYFATGKLKAETLAAVVKGLSKACGENGCRLLGGETAEMPGFYGEEDFDLAGFITGAAEGPHILDGSRVKAGDLVVGLPSTGLHTNGYSLARKILFEKLGWSVETLLPGTGKSVGELLLAVHRSYYHQLYPLVQADRLHALAHITGGGVFENIPRVLPKDLNVRIRTTWPVPELFNLLVREGGLDSHEAYRTFNMGIGMVALIDQRELSLWENDSSLKLFFLMGEVVPGEGRVEMEK